MKLTILGPNLRDQSRGQFHVHAEGCRDIGHYRGAPTWTADFDSRREVVEELYPPEDFGYDPEDEVDSRWYFDDVHFAPCATIK